MTEEEHKQRHIDLHKCFDELFAGFIKNTKEPPLDKPIRALIAWSYRQTKGPDHDPD